MDFFFLQNSVFFSLITRYLCLFLHIGYMEKVSKCLLLNLLFTKPQSLRYLTFSYNISCMVFWFSLSYHFPLIILFLLYLKSLKLSLLFLFSDFLFPLTRSSAWFFLSLFCMYFALVAIYVFWIPVCPLPNWPPFDVTSIVLQQRWIPRFLLFESGCVSVDCGSYAILLSKQNHKIFDLWPFPLRKPILGMQYHQCYEDR